MHALHVLRKFNLKIPPAFLSPLLYFLKLIFKLHLKKKIKQNIQITSKHMQSLILNEFNNIYKYKY